MKVIQIIVNLVYGDGMSNCLFYVKRLLDSCGVPNEVLVGSYLDPRVVGNGITTMDYVLDYSFSANDIVIYHYGTGDKLNALVERIPCRKLLVFQNVTPPEFFRDWNYEAYASCAAAYRDIKFTAGKYIHAITPSEFSKLVLVDHGWKEKDISVIPLYEIPDIDKTYDRAFFKKFSDGGTNILFTGRLAPNKKTEDVIRIFDFYNRNYDPDSRLILVGGSAPENYKDALITYIADSGIKNVVFTGHISDEERNAIYKASDVFLCMSEHEGFCIPILEAFQREIPVIAYRAAAVPDTMGDAGVLVDTKDPDMVCREIDRLVHDDAYRQEIVEKQLARLPEMTLSAHKDELMKLLQNIESIEPILKDNISGLKLKIPHPKVNNPVPVSQPAINSSAPSATSAQTCLKNESLAKNVKDIISEIVLGIETDGKVVSTIKDTLKKEIKKELVASPFAQLGKPTLVLYGIGKIGKMVFNNLFETTYCDLVAVCDNSYPENNYNGVPVYTHEECIRRCPKAKYLITVQKGYLKIFDELLAGGIGGENIYFYDSVRNRIESAC